MCQVLAFWIYLDQIRSKTDACARSPYATKTVPLTPVIRTEFIRPRPACSVHCYQARDLHLRELFGCSPIYQPKKGLARRVVAFCNGGQWRRVTDFLWMWHGTGSECGRGLTRMTLQLSIPIGSHIRLGAKYVHSVKRAACVIVQE